MSNGNGQPPSFEDKHVDLDAAAQREVRIAGERCAIELQEADVRLKTTIASAMQENAESQERTRGRLQRALASHVGEDLLKRLLAPIGTDDRREGLRLVVRVKVPDYASALKSEQTSETPRG